MLNSRIVNVISMVTVMKSYSMYVKMNKKELKNYTAKATKRRIKQYKK